MFPSSGPTAAANPYHANADRFGPPPRAISPALRAWAIQRYAAKIRWWVMIVVGVANMIGGVVFIAISLGSSAFGDPLGNTTNAQSQIDEAQRRTAQALQQAQSQSGASPMAQWQIQQAQQLTQQHFANAQQQAQGAVDSVASGFFWAGIGWVLLDFAVVGGLIAFFRARGARRGRALVSLLEQGSVALAYVQGNQMDWSIRVNGAPRRIVTLAVAGGAPVEIRTFDHGYADQFPQGATLDVLYHPAHTDVLTPVSAIPAL